jgi:hypothetical protein
MAKHRANSWVTTMLNARMFARMYADPSGQNLIIRIIIIARGAKSDI